MRTWRVIVRCETNVHDETIVVEKETAIDDMALRYAPTPSKLVQDAALTAFGQVLKEVQP